jgi:large subunit ribosomal protein L25
MSGIVLNVEVRERTGTGGAREARRAGQVPAVLYGGPRGAIAISLKSNEVIKAINSGKFISHMVEIDHKGERQPVIPRDVQFHPVTDAPMHIDLYRVEEGQLIKIEVPVHFSNEELCPGLKMGGALNIVRHTVELLVPADKIPEELRFDLKSTKLGDVVKISDFALPEGASPTITDRDFTIATVTGRGPSPKEDGDEDEAEGEA